MRGGRAEQTEHVRLHHGELTVPPLAARRDLLLVGLLVQPHFAAARRRELEVLHGIGDVDNRAIDARFFERVVEDPPGRADERPAFPVLLIAGLLAHQHQRGTGRPLAEHRLRRRLPEIAVLAARRLHAQVVEAGHSLRVPTAKGPRVKTHKFDDERRRPGSDIRDMTPRRVKPRTTHDEDKSPLDLEAELAAVLARRRALQQQTTGTRLGERLVAHGVVSIGDVERALAVQRERGLQLGEALIEIGAVSSTAMAQLVAAHLGVEYADLGAVQPDPVLASVIPEDVARRYRAIPLRRDPDAIVVAMARPNDVVAVDDLRMHAGERIRAVLAESDRLMRAIDAIYDGSTVEQTIDNASLDLDLDAEDDDAADRITVDDAPMVRLVNAIFEQAVTAGASDVHIEPDASGVRIRTRVDGVLHDTSEAPLPMLRSLIVRLKVLANLDIAQTRVPQDGRFSLSVHDRAVDVRVATLPTAAGEAAVLRILDPNRGSVSLDDLRLTASERDRLMPALMANQGAIIVAGPTGAGKTTSLYAMLQEINTREKSIVSIEDPVEYRVDGVKQIQVNPRADLTFPRALRSVLRSDPDVVLVGEIRDTETARIAASASITGHLVLSSLHSTSAAATAMRLADMGVERYVAASALTCIVSQRLVRTLCSRCARELPGADLSLLTELGAPDSVVEHAVIRTPVGCSACRNTGHRGRIPIFEIMPVTDEIRRMIMSGASTADVEHLAVEQGMDTLRIAAIRRVAAGEVGIDEMLRVVL